MVVRSLPKRPGAAYVPVVRMVSVMGALGVMMIYASFKVPSSTTLKASRQSELVAEDMSLALEGRSKRRLLSYDLYDDDGSGGDDDGDDDDNCTAPRVPHYGYNNSCDFVLSQCQGNVQLFNYLEFVLCNWHSVQWLGYIFLALWLLYLISLLATTADNFFVPPLNLLSEKLRLSPSIAGITLLALGNGAPDVFTAYAGLKQDDIQLVLGALIGASIFISTVVLGTIIIVVKVKSDDIDRIDFVRDVTAYMLVVALVIGVAYDGKVNMFEAVAFLLFYIIYIIIAVVISYIRTFHAKWKKKVYLEDSEETPILGSQVIQVAVSYEVKELINEEQDPVIHQGPKLELLGLTWPTESHIGGKIQFILEWPFSVLRWLSVPPCYYDDQWTKWHYAFAVGSPIPMGVLLLLAAAGWSGFYDLKFGELPVLAFVVMLGLVLSLILFFALSWKKPPHWSFQLLLGCGAFVMSIAWLNIEANEVVAVLNALGLLLDIDTGILGLTVLAIGNSVGDWVADTAVARAGKPGMGIASCFGSPLLNDVLGLSIALMVKIASDGLKPYTFEIHSQPFLKVKMSWIFLGISLLSSIIAIPLFKFSPPKPFGVALIYLYVVFMVFSILEETGHLNIDFLK